MALTNEELVILRDDIASDPAFAGLPHNSDGAWAVAAAYNLQAVPDFYLWKNTLSTADCKTAMVWTEFIGRTAGEREAWQFMLSNGEINPSDVNVRQGIADIFSGPSGLQSRTNLVAIAKRLATRIQKLFAVGTGSASVPATATVESISYQDVQDAWGL